MLMFSVEVGVAMVLLDAAELFSSFPRSRDGWNDDFNVERTSSSKSLLSMLQFDVVFMACLGSILITVYNKLKSLEQQHSMNSVAKFFC